jgi:hypothetical protein
MCIGVIDRSCHLSCALRVLTLSRSIDHFVTFHMHRRHRCRCHLSCASASSMTRSPFMYIGVIDVAVTFHVHYVCLYVSRSTDLAVTFHVHRVRLHSVTFHVHYVCLYVSRSIDLAVTFHVHCVRLHSATLHVNYVCSHSHDRSLCHLSCTSRVLTLCHLFMCMACPHISHDLCHFLWMKRCSVIFHAHYVTIRTYFTISVTCYVRDQTKQSLVRFDQRRPWLGGV